MHRIIDELKHFEGFSSTAYRCPAGYWTIGYGRNIESSGPGITTEEASLLLRNDVTRSIDEVCRAFPWVQGLDERRAEILTQLCFQLGLSRLQKFKKMLAALETEDFDRAADELLDSRLAQQVPTRAKHLADVLRGPGNA